MYKIYIDNDETKTLYLPADSVAALDNIEISLELGEAGSLEFDIYKTNPYYDELQPRETLITVLKDSEHLFDGQVREIEKNIDGSLNVYCAGEMSYLYDTIQQQMEFHGDPSIYFRDLINEHNRQVGVNSYAAFHPHTVSIPDDYIYRFANYQPTIDVIREDLLEPFSAYMKFFRNGSWTYIDVLPLDEYGRDNNQTIQFGSNLMDYIESETTDDLYTAVLPLGRKKLSFERDENDNPALDAYITVRDVNNDDQFIVNDDAAAQYGYVCALMQWDDIDVPETLRKTALAWLNSAQYKTLSLTLKAIDLSMLHSMYDDFRIGDMVRCVAEPFNVDVTLPVTQMKIYPLKPENNVLVIGSSTPSLTKQTVSIEETRSDTNDSNIVDWTYDTGFSSLVDWRGHTDDLGPNLFSSTGYKLVKTKMGSYYFKTSEYDGSYHYYTLPVQSLPNFTHHITYDLLSLNAVADPLYMQSKYTQYDGSESSTRVTLAEFGPGDESHETLTDARLFDNSDFELYAKPTGSNCIVQVASLVAHKHIRTLPWYVYDYEEGSVLDGVADAVNGALFIQGDIIVRATLPWDSLENKPGGLYARFAIKTHTELTQLITSADVYLIASGGDYIGWGPYEPAENGAALSISWGDYTRTFTNGELSASQQYLTVDLSEANLLTGLGPAEVNTYLQHLTIRCHAEYPIEISDFHLYGDEKTLTENPWAELWAF